MSDGDGRDDGRRRRPWRKRLAWFVFLYVASAAIALAVAYGLRALLFL